jgi:hypothetical protein
MRAHPELDPSHPVTCGLHVASLLEDNGLRVHDVFAETDVAVMHAYPMYLDWARQPLDPDLVPFTCALTEALTGKPVLMEEWGGCTAAPGEPSHVWSWHDVRGERASSWPRRRTWRTTWRRCCPRLVDVGATGAMLWCFADYAEHLWSRPLRRGAARALLRPRAARRFAEAARRRRVALDVTPEAYYADPAGHARRLYRAYQSGAGAA